MKEHAAPTAAVRLRTASLGIGQARPGAKVPPSECIERLLGCELVIGRLFPRQQIGRAPRDLRPGREREVGDEDYEYQVQFSAHEEVQLTDGTKKTNHFKINATVSPDGKVSAFNMSKINAAE